jgi:tight adherence protein B
VSTLTAALFGAVGGVGLWLTVGALAGWQLLPGRDALGRRGRQVQRLVATSGVALLAAALVLAVTGWPAGALLAGAATAAAPKLVGGGQARRGQVARTEAIAAWTESVRDTMAAAAGLQEAITASAVAPPAAIGREVRLLAARLRHQRLEHALAALGEDLRHPSGDLVVAALTIAARMEAADLTALLSRLAVSIRDDATMRTKIEASRARLRTSARIILGAVAATVVLLLVLNRAYLDAYDTLVGQMVLVVVGGIFAAGAWLLVRMSDIDLPDRFVPRGGAR